MILNQLLPNSPTAKVKWGQIQDNCLALCINELMRLRDSATLVIAKDLLQASRLYDDINFFLGKETSIPVMLFPDWEILPYDHFSPHRDIISERLRTLYEVATNPHSILIVALPTLLHRLPPKEYLLAQRFLFTVNESCPVIEMRKRLDQCGYHNVSQVIEHGEYTTRGSILDLFPMGSQTPYRIEFFDNEIASIRNFDPETQRSLEMIAQIDLLPAHEYPLTPDGISEFRSRWRQRFAGNPMNSPIYEQVSDGLPPGGIEYYIPLFFEHTDSLFDYLPQNTLVLLTSEFATNIGDFWQEVQHRFDQYSHDISRPLLNPTELFLSQQQFDSELAKRAQICCYATTLKDNILTQNLPFLPLPDLAIDQKAANPLHKLDAFLQPTKRRVLFTAETAGRKQFLWELLQTHGVSPEPVDHWQAFLAASSDICITIAPLNFGVALTEPSICIISENELLGQPVMQRRLRKQRRVDPDLLIKNLAELTIGTAVVHLQHGVGRYLGLQSMRVDDNETEFLVLEYADAAKLYVPVANLHLITRYIGSQTQAPLHRLGSDQWSKAKQKAAERLRDVAAHLLEIYAKRASQHKIPSGVPDKNFIAFSQAFPFEETPDQLNAINDVIQDMQKTQVMDRLICGDVGFGKTEVAMRAAFLCVQNQKQVVVLVPTTLLANQHYENFKDRFADYPVNIEFISRFQNIQTNQAIVEKLATGKIDIIIGTHKLLQKNIKFKNLGLIIIDEEHRFGVNQKEALKKIKTHVDVLTLTATPIPRTLNMAMAGLRDLSLIATPPVGRLSIKTFVMERNKEMLREAIMRELLRGGQVFYLHNDVATIEHTARDLFKLVPEAKIAVAHGQLRERELEQIMTHFYHLRYNVLVCTTIIETGIDIPTANTIIIDRADRFGLAQLHQLRGRVGRSHHQAYAYLLVPTKKQLTGDAQKRLEAIASLEDLGAGFILATHDLEIRGAGELLGEEQSGQMQAIGFSLYLELLEKTIASIKEGKELNIETAFNDNIEIDLHIPALIPETYVDDVHTRLILYKRIANSSDQEALDELHIELIDRFGLLPNAAQNLFTITEIKLKAKTLGICKIEAGQKHINVEFIATPHIKPEKIIDLVQKKPNEYQFGGSNRIKLMLNPKMVENDSQSRAEQRMKAVTELLRQLHDCS